MLDGLEQQAIVVETIARLRSHGSWAGETHVQKSLFFLKNLLRVPLNYNFVLYKHGPYSFDLHHDVGKMRAYQFYWPGSAIAVWAVVYPWGYGWKVAHPVWSNH